MPLDPIKISLVRAQGLSAVCSLCTKFWEGRDLNLPGFTCTSKNNCCGPLGGSDFPEYSGILVNFTNLCFVCGSDPKYGLRVGKSLRAFGVCSAHAGLLHQLRAKGKETQPLDVTGAPPESVRKQTLGEAIVEVEKFLSDESKKGDK